MKVSKWRDEPLLETPMIEPAYDRESTLELLSLCKELPSLPDRFVKIQKIIKDSDSDAHDLAEVIRSDQATSTMILKVANSAAFNPANTPVGELSKAITRLGSRETAHIASTMSLMYGLCLSTDMAIIRAFWAHAFGVAILTEHLAKQIDPDQNNISHELAFMTGLLHDIGRVALGLNVDFSYFEQETGHLHGDALIEMEEACYGVNHDEAGMRLLRMWNCPEDMCLAIGECHKPESSLLARLCHTADMYATAHLSDCAALECMHEKISDSLAQNPIDISSFQLHT
ncbi:HDOD domain-containing protein [Mariprofundus ferrinatatus]|uniref:HDOD domain-containing protein n=1 Tax=Mariprofundus ferrinatatus TaxID=1921087 RepID=A0A2K8L252_9PROT|nr:HDOD domain-containing protein [Mariprofundus ferrinatatus]ATX81388.1 HDOD domain-containing protein [Mariprofundus ferrinatatus]